MKKYLTTIALALALATACQAGDELKNPIIFDDIKAVDPKAMVDDSWHCGDPLSIDDGLVVFDFQLRWRLENRDNWIDFNDNYDLRDDMALAIDQRDRGFVAGAFDAENQCHPASP